MGVERISPFNPKSGYVSKGIGLRDHRIIDSQIPEETEYIRLNVGVSLR